MQTDSGLKWFDVGIVASSKPSLGTAVAAQLQRSVSYMSIFRRKMKEPFDHVQEEPLFMAIKADNQQILKAMEDAKQSLHDFREFIKYKQGANIYHSVKLRFRDPELSDRLGEDRHFYIWVSFVELNAEAFRGTLFEVPKEIGWLKNGEVLDFKDNDICDWMVNDNGRIYGGFTLRVSRQALPEDRRASFDKYMGAISWES